MDTKSSKKVKHAPKKGAPPDASVDVTVRALAPLHENDTAIEPGDEFTTTAARASALGPLVEVVQ